MISSFARVACGDPIRVQRSGVAQSAMAPFPGPEDCPVRVESIGCLPPDAPRPTTPHNVNDLRLSSHLEERPMSMMSSGPPSPLAMMLLESIGPPPGLTMHGNDFL